VATLNVESVFDKLNAGGKRMRKFTLTGKWDERTQVRLVPFELPDGDYVLFTDAEAEIEKARKEGEADGYAEGAKNVAFAYSEGPIAQKARAVEREGIIKDLECYLDHLTPDHDAPNYNKGFNEGLRSVIYRIRSRGEPKPKCGCSCHASPFSTLGGKIPDHPPHLPCSCQKIEPIKGLDIEDSDNYVKMVNRINALVDAVNEIRK
jgi:hypothetical protein